jgi:nucleotide sugar dehydrogenase
MTNDQHAPHPTERPTVGVGSQRLEVPQGRPVVAVQGLGFVGSAMAIAVASARTGEGAPAFTVVGVDLDDDMGRARVDALNEGRFPFETTDDDLVAALGEARRHGNLLASTDPAAYGLADVVVVDVPLDIEWRSEHPALRLEGFEAAIRTVAERVAPGTLVLVETTVPPGTTERVVVPTIEAALSGRGLDPSSVLVAHSYERVMPGADYLNSIINYWRVFAGHTEEAAKAAERFLSAIINVEDYPLTRLSNTTASETAKVLENTFRATTIALMDEWGQFAELAGVDLFEVVDAIRTRPTHANMRTPGFGVGGYCLTKDPLFAKLSSQVLFGSPLEFAFSSAAVRTNDRAPIRVLERTTQLLGGDLRGRHLLLLGISYRPDVGDTRYSPAETFVRAARDAGAVVSVHDPLVSHWDELDLDVPSELPRLDGVDAVVLAVPHASYRDIDVVSWFDGNRPVVVDGSDVWTAEQRRLAESIGCVVASIGRGPWT